MLIASTLRDKESLRRLGLRRPIAIIPHSIRLVAAATCPDSSGYEGPHRFRTALFLSRLHPGKGLPNPLNARALVAGRGWCLVIAGATEGSHLQKSQAKGLRLGISESVQYGGEARDNVKWDLYFGADVPVLPAHTENFGIVAAETLAHALWVMMATSE